MAKLILIFTLFCHFSLLASELKTGDILLQPLDCWSCNLIEQQENTMYSHIGIYLNLNGEDFVVEAYGTVRLVTLAEFLLKTQKGQFTLVRRFKGIDVSLMRAIKEKTLTYLGLPYDPSFLWNNEIKGQEAIYCSELIFKVFAANTSFKYLKTKEMLFDINPKLWDRHFKGKTPRGEFGISPEDFNSSIEFFDIVEL